jgi:peptidoglycan hydrolase CwlO-like protein
MEQYEQWEPISSKEINDTEMNDRRSDVPEFQEGKRPIAEDEKRLNELEQKKKNLELQLEEILNDIQDTDAAIDEIKNRIISN